MTSLSGQTYAFLMTILAGGVVGLLFDVYRVTRSALRPKQLATAMTDLLYWIVVTPTVFAMLLAGNWGEVRFYVLVGLGVGLLLYFQALSSTVIWALMAFFKGIGRLCGGVVYGLARVVIFPVVLIRDGCTRLGRFRGPARRGGWGRVPSIRWGRPRLRMAWHKLSLARLFGRFGC